IPFFGGHDNNPICGIYAIDSSRCIFQHRDTLYVIRVQSLKLAPAVPYDTIDHIQWRAEPPDVNHRVKITRTTCILTDLQPRYFPLQLLCKAGVRGGLDFIRLDRTDCTRQIRPLLGSVTYHYNLFKLLVKWQQFDIHAGSSVYCNTLWYIAHERKKQGIIPTYRNTIVAFVIRRSTHRSVSHR